MKNIMAVAKAKAAATTHRANDQERLAAPSTLMPTITTPMMMKQAVTTTKIYVRVADITLT